jgi:hypothetical protein
MWVRDQLFDSRHKHKSADDLLKYVAKRYFFINRKGFFSGGVFPALIPTIIDYNLFSTLKDNFL